MSVFKNKIILWIWLLSLSILLTLYYFIPYSTEKNVHNIFISNAQQMVEQMKLTRSYYLQNVVKNIKEANTTFEFVAQHNESHTQLPLPSTLIHDLSVLYSEKTGIGFRTYSEFPFKNRINRILLPEDKKVLKEIEKSPNGVYTFENVDDNPVLKVAIADFMDDMSCVNCHNNHVNRTWKNTKWKLGDVRGVIEITMPLEKPLEEIAKIKNSILYSIGVIFVVFMVYYSLLYLRREDELLEKNKELDKRVLEEVEKNKEKEQVLIQKSKLSSMGEMLNNIAHQWRQPLSELSSIMMNIDMRYSHGKLDKDFMNQKMTKAENLLEYLSYTIDDFKNFFAVTKEKETFNLKKVIESTLHISNIQVDLELEEGLTIYGYATEFSQVLLNILSNSRDAFDENKIENREIRILSKRIEDTICISIYDNAGGIKATNIEDIFKLYYTKKEEGSGIGLYMSRLIIEKHFNGNLLASNVKKGSCFEIKL